ncbi:MAG: TolC family protein [Pseudomonadota bacterium]
MNYRLRRAGVAALVGCWVFARAALAADSADATLTLREAIEATLQANPGLAVYPSRAAAIAGQRTTAELRPPLQLNAGIENVLGSGALNVADAAEVTLSLSKVIELGEQRQARVGIATQRVDMLRAEQQVTELDVLAEVTRRFIDTAAAQESLAAQQRNTALAQQTVDLLQPLVAAGQTPQAEQVRARAALARAQLEESHAVATLQAARISLASMWASQSVDFAAVSAGLLEAGDAGDLAGLLMDVEANPDILLFASEERLLDAQVREAISDQRGTAQWTAGVRHLSDIGDTGFVVGFSMPLGSRERATGAIATARANYSEVASKRAIALNNMRAQLQGLHLQLQQAILEVNTLRADVLPQLNTALEQTRSAYLGGRYSYVELVSAQAEVLDAQRAMIAAATSAHLLRVEIERLSGGALDTETGNAATQENNP